jgi:ABC-type proline/glycine betaine transport system permease subunit
MASLTTEGEKMEFAALFLSILVVLAITWWGSRQWALALFTIALIASVATYFHHATDVLKLSF